MIINNNFIYNFIKIYFFIIKISLFYHLFGYQKMLSKKVKKASRHLDRGFPFVPYMKNIHFFKQSRIHWEHPI